ncbi:MAG: zinc ribbon domain-containing protein [Candidatus Heimdallarchaeaceae archaeon]
MIFTDTKSYTQSPRQAYIQFHDELEDIEQKAWQIGDPEKNLAPTPLYIKKEANLFSSFQVPKVSLEIFRQYGIFSLLLLGILHIIQGLLWFLEAAIICSILHDFPLSFTRKTLILLITVSLSAILSFVIFKIAIKLSKENKEENKVLPHRVFATFMIINLSQFVLLGALFVLTTIIIEKNNNGLSAAIFFSTIVATATVGSIVSLPFRIAKMLSLMRKTGIFQNFADAYQFSKLSSRRGYGMVLVSILIPTLIMIGGLYPTTSVFYKIFLKVNILNYSNLDFAIFGTCLILIVSLSLFSTLEDISITQKYEHLLHTFADPPNIDWINKEKKKEEETQKHTEFIDILGEESILEEDAISYCPKCSSAVPEDVNYCVVCGYKLR